MFGAKRKHIILFGLLAMNIIGFWLAVSLYFVSYAPSVFAGALPERCDVACCSEAVNVALDKVFALRHTNFFHSTSIFTVLIMANFLMVVLLFRRVAHRATTGA